MVQPLWKAIWLSLKNLKVELVYDPGILFLGIHSKKSRDSSIYLYTRVHSINNQKWKQVSIDR